MLKENSKKILDIIATQTSQNASEAYRQIHPNANINTVKSNVHRLMNKTEAKVYLQKHTDNARNTIVELLSSNKEDIRLRSATDILDRSYGKAKQITEVTTSSITLKIDLSSSLEDFEDIS